ncbi:hypothetical protein CCP4SC76_1030006 [Gammaproteobacteria bacterium]
MKHRIDPKVDCVFKALLGSEENRQLLIHFLNAILSAELSGPIVEVEILNPYNDKEFLTDKLSIVDVKAKDKSGRVFQVEIQMCAYPSLPKRMVYNWADIFSQQLQTGGDYTQLKPVSVFGCWPRISSMTRNTAGTSSYGMARARCRLSMVEFGFLSWPSFTPRGSRTNSSVGFFFSGMAKPSTTIRCQTG